MEISCPKGKTQEVEVVEIENRWTGTLITPDGEELKLQAQSPNGLKRILEFNHLNWCCEHHCFSQGCYKERSIT